MTPGYASVTGFHDLGFVQGHAASNALSGPDGDRRRRDFYVMRGKEGGEGSRLLCYDVFFSPGKWDNRFQLRGRQPSAAQVLTGRVFLSLFPFRRGLLGDDFSRNGAPPGRRLVKGHLPFAQPTSFMH